MENRIVALTFVQEILAGAIFNTKRREKSKCKEERESFVLLCLHSFLSLSFQRPRQTRERKFIYTFSSADRLSAAFLYRDW